MTHSPISSQERFAKLAESFQSLPDITPPSPGRQASRRFGSSTLKVKQKIFAMLVDGKLVVKLPQQRVEALIASGVGTYYDPRQDGRVMKEWITLGPAADGAWMDLAREAMQFVASRS